MPEQAAKIDRNPALKELLRVSSFGHVPTRGDLMAHPELVALWEKLPEEIAKRLANAWSVHIAADPDHPVRVVEDAKNGRHRRTGSGTGPGHHAG